MSGSPERWWEKASRREDVHWFRYRDRAFLLDVNSGSIFALDSVAWSWLEALASSGGDPSAARGELLRCFSAAEVQEAWEELDSLHRQGLLLGPDPVSKAGVGPEAFRSPWVKALCLNVAHACNLRCRYCFAVKGQSDGPPLMPPEVGRAAVDFLLRQAPEGADLEIDFFGGEPLLNFPLVEFLIPYALAQAAAQGKRVRFTLTTNGVLLNEKVLRFLNRYGVQLILSLDGRPQVHDRYRVFADRRGSYLVALPNLKRAVATRGGENYYVRGTFTRHNLDFSQDVAHLVALGFRRISLEPVVADPGEDYALRPEDAPALCREYDRVVDLCLEEWVAGRTLTFFHFEVDLEPGLCLPKRLSGCGAGHQYLAVTPGGELYPCHQFVGRPEFRLGSLAQDIVNRALQERLASLNVLAKACRSCWARYFCGGGCHVSNLNSGGLDRPYPLGCVLVKKRLECAIYLKSVGQSRPAETFTSV
jgi:uncharacterized protein